MFTYSVKCPITQQSSSSSSSINGYPLKWCNCENCVAKFIANSNNKVSCPNKPKFYYSKLTAHLLELMITNHELLCDMS